MNKTRLKLYVTGGTPRGQAAVANARRVCDELMRGEYRLVVIDVLEWPQLAELDRVLVTPTLIRELPLPGRRVLGDLSDLDSLRVGLQPSA